MPDPIVIEPSAAPAPAPAPVVVDAAPAPAPAPSVAPETPPPASPDQVAPVEAAPVVAEPAAAGAETPTEHKPTLLEEALEPKKDEAKPVEGEKPAETVEAKPEGEVAKVELPPIDYFAAEGGITVPETLKLDDGQRTALTEALDGYRAEPGIESAQKIIDLGAKMMTDYAEHTSREQWRVFNETNEKWKTDVMADPVIGGSGHLTAMKVVGDVIAALVPKEERAAFNEMLRVTGAGNHPAFLRAFHRGGKFFKEAGPPPPNPTPPPNNGRRPGKRGAGEIYTNTTFK